MAVAALKAKIKVCMVDQYGTVVDMQKGLTEVVTPYLREKGWSGRPDAFVTWWRRTHFENSMIDALLHQEHTSYREIGHRAVAYTLEPAGIPHTMDEVHAVSRRTRGAGPLEDAIQDRRALERRSRHAGRRQGLSQDSVRRGDLGRRGQLVQASRGDVPEGRPDRRRANGRSPVRRQPRLRLHRGQGGRHAHRVHRPTPAPLRRYPAPTRHRRAGHEEPRRHEVHAPKRPAGA